MSRPGSQWKEGLRLEVTKDPGRPTHCPNSRWVPGHCRAPGTVAQVPHSRVCAGSQRAARLCHQAGAALLLPIHFIILIRKTLVVLYYYNTILMFFFVLWWDSR